MPRPRPDAAATALRPLHILALVGHGTSRFVGLRITVLCTGHFTSRPGLSTYGRCAQTHSGFSSGAVAIGGTLLSLQNHVHGLARDACRLCNPGLLPALAR